MGNKSAYESLLRSTDHQTLTSATLIILFWCWNGQKWSCGDVPVVLSLTRSFPWILNRRKARFILADIWGAARLFEGWQLWCLCVCVSSVIHPGFSSSPFCSIPLLWSYFCASLLSSSVDESILIKKKKKQAGEAEMRCNRIAVI